MLRADMNTKKTLRPKVNVLHLYLRDMLTADTLLVIFVLRAYKFTSIFV